ncbi:hypothetical protein [Halorarius halobius]|uniref:hypothetical protein n=1 Tax=Halorarius halobius TaxID=2962671 RepID=UPI0020CE7453|nr:hypothetical protein [Halorarius halobius]
MADAMGLFTKGVKWSYRKYGVKGAAAFVLAGVVAYYVVSEKIDAALEGDTEGESGDAA